MRSVFIFEGCICGDVAYFVIEQAWPIKSIQRVRTPSLHALPPNPVFMEDGALHHFIRVFECRAPPS